MTTEARIAANRANAKKSTGPRTPEGKARSSRNALTHGLRAETLSSPDVAIVGESPDEFTGLLDALVAELAPVGAMEEALVETVAVSIWRLRRSLRVENGEIARAYYIAPADDPAPAARASLPDTDRLNAVVRYEAHVQRQLDRALRQLAALRRARDLRQAIQTRAQQVAARFDDPDLFNPSRGGITDPATFYAGLADIRPPAPTPHHPQDRTGPVAIPAERTQSGLDHPATLQGGGRENPALQGGGQENPARVPAATDRTHAAPCLPHELDAAEPPVLETTDRTQSAPCLPDEPAIAEPPTLETTDRTHPAPVWPDAACDHPADPARPPAAEGQFAGPPPPGPRSLAPGRQRPPGAHQPSSRTGPKPNPLVQALAAAITSQLLTDRDPASLPPLHRVERGRGGEVAQERGQAVRPVRASRQ